MENMKNSAGKPVLLKIISAIQEQKDYLSEVDGLIADGDHGMNMNKGFTMFADKIKDMDLSFSSGLNILGNILLSKIGGSMGPIYGTLFISMAERGEEFEEIGLNALAAMLDGGLAGLRDIVEADVGDKTLMDALIPANNVLQKNAKEGKGFAETLNEIKVAAVKGRDSTKDLTAKFGRSSRLGDRSRGVLDAGAVSCCIILCAMADGILEQTGA